MRQVCIRVWVKYSSSSTQVHQVLTHHVEVQYAVHHNTTRRNFDVLILLENVVNFIIHHERIIYIKHIIVFNPGPRAINLI